MNLDKIHFKVFFIWLKTALVLHFIIYNDNDSEVCFVLDQNAELDFYSATSLKQ
jgi:hypothetical protein